MKVVEANPSITTLNSKDFIFRPDINQYAIDIKAIKTTINKGFTLVIP